MSAFKTYEFPHATIYEGHVLDVLKSLPSESVDLIVTSPPYWGLRDYGEETNTIWGGNPNCEHEFDSAGFCKKCGAWYGELGLEPTLDLYIDHLLLITAELKRVLKKSGIMFWDHGDKYEGDKTLSFQNYRLAIRMVEEQGWICRNQIVWHKPNHIPGPWKDRFTNAWEPVFFFTKSKKYWSDLDAVRLPHKNGSPDTWSDYLKKLGRSWHDHEEDLKKGNNKKDVRARHPLGKNPGDVWTIPTKGFPEAHFATFPPDLVRPMVKFGCPKEICKKCRKARERITHKEYYIRNKSISRAIKLKKEKEIGLVQRKFNGVAIRCTVGWTDCGCNAGWQPGVVLDPFMGSGTTGLVALEEGCDFIGIEINPEYVQMAIRRMSAYIKSSRLEDFDYAEET